MNQKLLEIWKHRITEKKDYFDVYEYLKYLLNEIQYKEFNKHPEILNQFLL